MALSWSGQDHSSRIYWSAAATSTAEQPRGKERGDGDYPVSARELIPSPNSCYEVLDFLGKGTFGQVVKCWRRDTNELVALKILKNTPSYAKQGQVEVDVLCKLSHVSSAEFNFVTAYESFTHRGHICIAFELLQVNLYDYLKKNSFAPLPLHHIRPIAQQVLSCLCKLRELGLVHADLKPENIMLVDPERQPFRVKVIDFGSTTHRSRSNATTYLQSRYYRAPEVILGQPYDEAIDVWSLGCVLVELFLGWPLFPGGCEFDQVSYIVQMLGPPPDALLGNVAKASCFFRRDPATNRWKLKTQQQYEMEGGLTRSKEPRKFVFTSVADIIRAGLLGNQGPEGAVLQLDQLQFAALLQGMLTFDPSQRLSPAHALQQHYITMQHLSTHTNTLSVRSWIQSMQVCCQSRTTHSLSPPSPYTPPHPHPSPPTPQVGYHIAPSTFGYFPLSRVALETALCHGGSRSRQPWCDTDTGYVSADPSPATVISLDSSDSAPLYFAAPAIDHPLTTLTPAHPHYFLCNPPHTELCYVLPSYHHPRQQALVQQEQLYSLAYHSRV